MESHSGTKYVTFLSFPLGPMSRYCNEVHNFSFIRFVKSVPMVREIGYFEM